MEKVNRVAAAREAATQRVLEDRIREENEQVERECRDRCREMEIQRRRSTWEAAVAEEVVSKVEATRLSEEQRQQRLAEAKDELFTANQQAAAARAEAKSVAAMLEAKRDARIAELQAKRLQKGADDADRLRNEAEEEDLCKARRQQHKVKGSSRCCLVLPASEGPRPACPGVEARRQANIQKRERERTSKEAARVQVAKTRAETSGLLAKLSGETERALLMGERSIFETPVLPEGPAQLLQMFDCTLL